MSTQGAEPVKVLISGGFGVGKTTFIGAISEIDPLRTEAPISGLDDQIVSHDVVPDKVDTTVAMDFGRISIGSDLVLYLFGTPGQERFEFMRDDLATGAMAAIVLIDSRRIEESFSSIDFYESRGIPFVVAINSFDGRAWHSASAVRASLRLAPTIPLFRVDARQRESVKSALLVSLQQALRQAEARLAA